jgi:hypothetical protein
MTNFPFLSLLLSCFHKTDINPKCTDVRLTSREDYALGINADCSQREELDEQVTYLTTYITSKEGFDKKLLPIQCTVLVLSDRSTAIAIARATWFCLAFDASDDFSLF